MLYNKIDISNAAGMVFTSQTAVEAAQSAVSANVSAPTGLSGCCEILGEEEPTWRRMLKEQWSSRPVFVVGKATAQAGK